MERGKRGQESSFVKLMKSHLKWQRYDDVDLEKSIGSGLRVLANHLNRYADEVELDPAQRIHDELRDLECGLRFLRKTLLKNLDPGAEKQ